MTVKSCRDSELSRQGASSRTPFCPLRWRTLAHAGRCGSRDRKSASVQRTQKRDPVCARKVNFALRECWFVGHIDDGDVVDPARIDCEGQTRFVEAVIATGQPID